MVLVWLKVQSFTDCRFFYLVGYYDLCWLLTVRYYCLTVFIYFSSPVRPPQLWTYSFHLMSAWFTLDVPDNYRTSFCLANLSTSLSLNIKFLYVRPDICRGLPSDSTSRWTPLPLAIYFPLSGRFRDLHPLEYVRAGRTKKTVSQCEKRFLIFSRQVDYLRKPSSLTIERYLVISLSFR